MSDRETILRALMDLYNRRRPNSFLYADEMPNFGPPEFAAAVNQLLSEGLIRGAEGDEVPGSTERRLLVGINHEKSGVVRQELAAVWFRDPRFIIPALAAVAGLVWAVVSVFL